MNFKLQTITPKLQTLNPITPNPKPVSSNSNTPPLPPRRQLLLELWWRGRQDQPSSLKQLNGQTPCFAALEQPQPEQNQRNAFYMRLAVMPSATFLRSPSSRLLEILARVSQRSPRHHLFPFQALQMCCSRTHSVLWIPPSILKTAGECTGKHLRVQATHSRLQRGLSRPHLLSSSLWHYFAPLSRWLSRAHAAASRQHRVRVRFKMEPLLRQLIKALPCGLPQRIHGPRLQQHPHPPNSCVERP